MRLYRFTAVAPSSGSVSSGWIIAAMACGICNNVYKVISLSFLFYIVFNDFVPLLETILVDNITPADGLATKVVMTSNAMVLTYGTDLCRCNLISVPDGVEVSLVYELHCGAKHKSVPLSRFLVSITRLPLQFVSAHCRLFNTLLHHGNSFYIVKRNFL